MKQISRLDTPIFWAIQTRKYTTSAVSLSIRERSSWKVFPGNLSLTKAMEAAIKGFHETT